ncbi:MAG: ISAs1 family transposase, partial [Terriglobia bacterium]
KDLPRDALRRLGSRRWKPPSESTFRRVLQKLDANRLDAEIGPWLLKHCSLSAPGVSVDGKTLRGAHDAGQTAPHLLSAILHQEGIVVAQRAVGEKTNEIPELLPLLAPLPIEGGVVTADALHTQTETARYLVEEKKADYLFTVKDNQPTLKQDIADLNLKAFPPSAHHAR